MTTITDIYNAAEAFINQFLRKEMVAQGHHLTGAMEDSLDSQASKKGKADIMEGFAILYTQFVNDGVPASSASFKQFPFLVEYFRQKGFGEREAKGAAAATIRTWMKEGMPTQASKRFSSTGSRTNMIEAAFTANEHKVDEYMANSFDFAVNEMFHKEKSETI